MTIKGEVRGALMKRFLQGLGDLPMTTNLGWLPYSPCQSCTWQQACQDGAAHCSHSWVTPWPCIYIFPVHWENKYTHKSCHKWRQRQKVAPEDQVELLSSKLYTPDKGFQKSKLNSWPNNQTVQKKQYLEHTDLVRAVHTQKSPVWVWNTTRHLNQGKERDTFERHWSHATEPSSGS